jgi:hypothetical protein
VYIQLKIKITSLLTAMVFMVLPLTGICQIAGADNPGSIFSFEQDMEGYSIRDLLQKAVLYPHSKKISKANIYSQEEPNRTQVIMNENFLIYSAGFTKHPLGKLSYTLTLEPKDQNYRFTYTNIHFLPYARNRYGRFTAVNRQQESIAAILGKSTKQSASIRKALIKHFDDETKQLKVFMSERQ